MNIEPKSALQLLVEAYAALPADRKATKTRSLQPFTESIATAHFEGFALTVIWRRLREVGYQGAYSRFLRVFRRRTIPGASTAHKQGETVGLDSSRAEVLVPSPMLAASSMEEKPAWQIRRERSRALTEEIGKKAREVEAVKKAAVVFKFDPNEFGKELKSKERFNEQSVQSAAEGKLT